MSSLTKTVIRPYKAGDARKICDFFSTQNRNVDFWVWINRMLSPEKNLVAVVEDNEGKIVGHQGLIINYLWVHDVRLKVGMGIHTVLAPEFRDSGYILDLKNLMNDMAKEQDVCLIYGFPNKNARPVVEKVEKYQRVSLFNAYELESARVPVSQNPQIEIKKVEDFDYFHIFQLSELLESTPHTKVALDKTVNYYLTRYVYHPHKLYDIYRISYGDQTGYLFGKFFGKEGRTYFHIVDYIFGKDGINKDILDFILSYFKERCDMFSFWKGYMNFESLLQEAGFEQMGFDTCLDVKFLDQEKLSSCQKETILDFKNWSLVMGDSDAF